MDSIKVRMDRIVSALVNVDAVMREARNVERHIDDLKRVDDNVIRDVEQLEALTSEYRDARNEYLACTDDDMRGRLDMIVEDRMYELDTYDIREWLYQLVYDIEHQVVPSRTQLPIYEITDDNGVGIEVPEGDRKSVNYGWTAEDVLDLVSWATSYSIEEFRSIMDEMDRDH